MPNRGPIALLPAVAAALLATAAVPAGAAADNGDSRGDVRVTRSCTAKSRAELRVRTRDHDELRIDLVVRTGRRGAPWTVVIVHERQLVLRESLRTSGSSGTLSLRRTIADWFGEDTLSVRATGPRGETCRVSATIDDD